MSEPPIDDWARQHALLEVCRIARELPNPDFERDVQPRLGRLTPGQRAILEAGVLLLRGRGALGDQRGGRLGGLMELRRGDAVAVALRAAIQGGDRPELERLLAEHAGLASARILDRRGSTRTPLHDATDWPGYFPDGPAIVATLCDAGADPSAPILGAPHAETPLHWAASSDDVDVAAVLIDRGADLEAQGASIAGGSPLDDAVGYGCWHVARLLVDRGARVDRLWLAAALGLRDRLDALLAAERPTQDQLNEAFWQACHGGQRRVAEHLLGLGADLDAHPGYTDRTPLQIAASPGTRRDALVTWLRERGAAGD